MNRYRLHFVIMADSFVRPRRFHTEAYAGTVAEAWEAGEGWLRAQPIRLTEVMQVSSECVPEDSGVPL